MGRFQTRWHRGVAIKPIVQRANAIKISVKSGGGKPKKMPSVEFLIEQQFILAIKGDVKAHKSILNWAKKYLLPGDKKKLFATQTREITQADVDLWKAAGALPSHCTPVLEKINLKDLNRAYRAYKKSQPGWVVSDRSIRALRDWFRHVRAELQAERRRAQTRKSGAPSLGEPTDSPQTF